MRPLLSVAAILLLTGCKSDPDDTAEEVFQPDLPVEMCGGEDHGWLPADDDLGRVVEFEYIDELSMEAPLIASLLSTAGIDFIEPVYDVKTFRIRYLTQDRGVSIEATAFVSFPDLQPGEDLEAISMMWGHGTSGFTDACAPTSALLEGGAFNLAFSSIGYAVASPDYLGMNGWGEPAPFLHPYINPEATGVASLDALRAMWRFEADTEQLVDPTLSRRTVFFGGSEGGFAALWADRYASGYLPEAEVVATAALVPPTDVTGLAVHGVTTLGPTTEGLAAILATNHGWYDAGGALSDAFTDADPTYFASTIEQELHDNCGGWDALDSVDSIDDLYATAFIEAIQGGDDGAAAPFSCYLQTADLRSTAVPRGHDAPLLFQVSELDDLVVGSIERADFPRLCDAGYEAEYLECAGLGHSEGAVAALPYSLAWLDARIAGEAIPAAKVCVQEAPVDCDAL